MYNKKVWNTGERITADKLNNIEEGVYSNALVNKTQQVYINGLFNENKDGRLSVEGEGNSLKLEGSKEGLVEVDKVVGNTLVNLNNTTTFGISYNLVDNYFILDLNFSSSGNWRTGEVFVSRKPSTTECTFIFNIRKNTLNKEISFDGHQSLINEFVRIPINKTGLFISKVTIKDYDSLRLTRFPFAQSLDEGGEFEIGDFMLLEGDYTNKPIPSEVFEGLKSSFEENLVTQEMVNEGLESEENLGKYKVPVRIVGKNKFNSKIEIGTYNAETGKKQDFPTRARSKKLVKISPNKTYSMYITDNYMFNRIYFYDINGIFITAQSIDNKNASFTSPNNANFIATSMAKGTYGDSDYVITNDDLVAMQIGIQLEEGTVATDREDYFERTTNVYLNSPLLEGDEIVMKDGELCHYHKCDEGVFDGSDDETWNPNTPTETHYNWYSEDIQGKAKSSGNLICDKLPLGSASNNSVTGIRLGSTRNVTIVLPIDEVTDGNTTSIKQWLQSNPISVVYELAEPYHEVIQADKLLLECANDSTLHIDTVVPVESVKASYTGNVPSVYALEETNQTQDSLIDISLCATDEMYMMLEPILEAVPQTLNNERMVSKMVDMYVAMVIRGLKTIDEVPVRYREQVKEILAQLEK